MSRYGYVLFIFYYQSKMMQDWPAESLDTRVGLIFAFFKQLDDTELVQSNRWFNIPEQYCYALNKAEYLATIVPRHELLLLCFAADIGRKDWSKRFEDYHKAHPEGYFPNLNMTYPTHFTRMITRLGASLVIASKKGTPLPHIQRDTWHIVTSFNQLKEDDYHTLDLLASVANVMTGDNFQDVKTVLENYTTSEMRQ